MTSVYHDVGTDAEVITVGTVLCWYVRSQTLSVKMGRVPWADDLARTNWYTLASAHISFSFSSRDPRLHAYGFDGSRLSRPSSLRLRLDAIALAEICGVQAEED